MYRWTAETSNFSINKYVVNLKELRTMSRPKPNVLESFTDKNTFRREEVLDADAIWAVFYKGKPFNLKSSNSISPTPGPKYKKTSFSNPGHAINLAKKLNVLFKTDQFTVVLLKSGDQIFP